MFTDGTTLGFNSTITPTQNSQKTIHIVKQGKKYHILINMLLFSSFSLHRCGMTVWTGNEATEQAIHLRTVSLTLARKYGVREYLSLSTEGL